MARAAVRDAGRVLEIPYGTVDRIAKLIPEGPKVYLEDCLKPNAELRQAYDTDPLVKEIVDLARPLEGLVRQDSIHAAGVVIGDRPLTEYLPLQQKGPDAEVVTQFPMGDVDALGLLKMDFLGLRNLDVIDEAVALVGDLDIAKIPLDDRPTYEMLARGEATGVFQFESSGMREALRQVKPTVFEDLVALVALYRPGPMALHPDLREAQGRARSRSRSSTRGSKPITARHLRHLHLPGAVHADRQAAWPASRPTEAETLRKAIGKKIHALMASLKDKFLEGCAAERRHARGREPALEGHGAGAGLLVQQGARRLLRADRLPHRVPARAPPGRVHGRAHLVGDEHEGPGAVLRQRVPRDGDRGAAARREHVAGRLRGRRGQDPLRAERGEERRRPGRRGDRAGARGGRARSRRSGSSPSASTRRS